MRVSGVSASFTATAAPRSTPGGSGTGGGAAPELAVFGVGAEAGGTSGRIGRTGSVATSVATSRCCSVAGARSEVTAYTSTAPMSAGFCPSAFVSGTLNDK